MGKLSYEPLKCTPIYKQMIWGGENLNKLYNRTLPFEKVGESWELTCRPDDISVVATGTYKNKTIDKVFELDKEGFLGKLFKDVDNFPLLVKIIDANDDLSVQVHPTDDYAKTYDVEPLGKTECWYVLHAPQNAEIVIGLNDDVNKQNFSDAIDNGKVSECIRKVAVKAGDVFDIQPGTVHAITSGLIIYEVQQNSNLTYRVYDYDRTDKDGNKRELHIQKAKDVIDYKYSPQCVVNIDPICINGNEISNFIKNNYFSFYKVNIKSGNYTCTTSVDQFSILTVIDGSCEINTTYGNLKIDLGETVFLPAKMGKYEVNGICQILMSNP